MLSSVLAIFFGAVAVVICVVAWALEHEPDAAPRRASDGLTDDAAANFQMIFGDNLVDFADEQGFYVEDEPAEEGEKPRRRYPNSEPIGLFGSLSYRIRTPLGMSEDQVRQHIAHLSTLVGTGPGQRVTEPERDSGWWVVKFFDRNG